MPRAIKTIGFVGLGNMGRPMAMNLVRSPYDVVGYDADPTVAQAFDDATGSRIAPTLEALGDMVDIVITMLPDGAAVRSVSLEMENGALARELGGGSFVIDMSSSDPVGTRSLGSALTEHGVSLIDAPVSGGVAKAEDGTLAILIGSDEDETLEAATPILRRMGNRLFRAGALGAGHAAKALNNYVAAAAFAATSEALIVGKEFGLEPSALLDIINNSTGRNFNAEVPIKTEVITGRFASGFKLGLMTKDIATAADLATTLRSEAPLCQFMRERWLEACDAEGGDADFTRAHAFWKGPRPPRRTTERSTEA